MLRILFIAIAYAAAGKLSLLLAIPPGYATAVFPPAGIALAAILAYGRSGLPGVWLGSLLLNLWTTFDNQSTLTLISFALAASIGAGAMLQAWFGAALIRRFVGYPTTLDDMDSIVGFFLLGGPLACTLNATAGNATLVMAGVVDSSDFMTNWFVWWTGDTIGVLIAAPWALSMIGAPREAWRTRRAVVTIPSAITLCVVVIMFFRASDWENDRIQFAVQQRADAAIFRLLTNLSSDLEALTAVKSFFAASSVVEPDEFKMFAATMLATRKGLSALEWAPQVTDAQRGQFERRARGADDAPLVIRERDATGSLVTATNHADYYPVLYVEPRSGNETAIGYDVGSERTRRTAMQRAIDRRAATATTPIPLVQYTPSQLGFLVFLPTKGRDITNDEPVEGFVIGAFLLDQLAETATTRLDRRDFHIRIFERDNTQNQWLTLPAQGRLSSGAAPSYRTQMPLDLAGIPMIVEYTPLASYINEQRPWQAWGMLAGGLLFTSLLGAFLLFVTGQSARTLALVDNRTRQLNNAVTALSENESRLQAILESAGDGIITVGADGKILTANRAATRLLGAGELPGQPFTRFLSVNGRQILDEHMALRDAGKKDNKPPASRVTDLTTHDAKTIPVLLTIGDVRLESGHQWVVIMHDMTEQRRIDELKGEFVATVSHELRTPLTSIRGSLGLILGGALGAVPDQIRRMLDMAVQNAERLTFLINDILDIEKIESGAMAFNVRPLPLRPLIQHAIDVNSGYARTFGVEVRFARDDSNEAAANVDPDRYTQVMTNLLSNAIKFSPRGAAVEVELTREARWLRVAVKDHGPGIPEEFRSRVFQKFAQADSSTTRKHSGTGLGLSITKAIVERLGGEIGFTSRIGEGTEFFVRLPAFD